MTLYQYLMAQSRAYRILIENPIPILRDRYESWAEGRAEAYREAALALSIEQGCSAWEE